MTTVEITGTPIYAMMWDCYREGFIQYSMNGFIVGRAVAVFKLKPRKK
jgi:hypothetical protein